MINALPDRRTRPLGLLLSMLIHFALVAFFVTNPITPDSERSSGATRRISKELPSTRVTLLAPPPGSVATKHSNSNALKQLAAAPGPTQHRVGVPEVEIPTPDSGNFMDALSREGGLLGLSLNPEGGRVTRILRVSDGEVYDLETPQPLSRFFAIELVDLGRWPRVPPAWREYPNSAVFALFPVQMAARIADKAAQTAGCEGGAAHAVVRFVRDAPGGFQILSASGPCVSQSIRKEEQLNDR
jgi:hypothetical protein